jgi:NADP-dependent 3-hydroxy acid dehydrogenase YdfG
MNLRGAVVVVTGASAGIGRATALAFARSGSVLVLSARRSDLLEDLAEEIGRRGGRALAVPANVMSDADVAALAERTLVEHGRCDVLVNNAGVPGGGPFADVAPERIDAIVRTNLLGVLSVTHAILPAMLQRGRGHVVNVASIAGLVALPGAAVYSATKHAVVAFSEALDGEVRDRGVRVTAVNPGLVRTEGFPQEGVPGPLLVRLDSVADAIVRVARDGMAPSVSVPRAAAVLPALHGLAPPLFRAGVRAVMRARGR